MPKYFALVILTAIFLIAYSSSVIAQQMEPWQKDFEWAFNDGGPPNCPEKYAAFGAYDCLIGGILFNGAKFVNRSCMMYRAQALAMNGYCAQAFQAVLVTQCHSDGGPAREHLRAAGPEKVCSEIKLYSPIN